MGQKTHRECNRLFIACCHAVMAFPHQLLLFRTEYTDLFMSNRWRGEEVQLWVVAGYFQVYLGWCGLP